MLRKMPHLTVGRRKGIEEDGVWEGIAAEQLALSGDFRKVTAQ
jgi:hypothetical protein